MNRTTPGLVRNLLGSTVLFALSVLKPSPRGWPWSRSTIETFKNATGRSAARLCATIASNAAARHIHLVIRHLNSGFATRDSGFAIRDSESGLA